MRERIEAGGLYVDAELFELVKSEIAPGTGVEPDAFWTALGRIAADLGPGNRALLQERDAIQAKIDAWHRSRKGLPLDAVEYGAFLGEIGYLLPEGEDFRVAATNVDPEIAALAGPQLVVPVDNARYALNAANARWGSLFDALYGTDVISEEGGAEKGECYNPVRGAAVISRSMEFLDQAAALERGSYAHVTRFTLALAPGEGARQLEAELEDGSRTGLGDGGKFAGYKEEEGGSRAYCCATTVCTSRSR